MKKGKKTSGRIRNLIDRSNGVCYNFITLTI